MLGKRNLSRRNLALLILVFSFIYPVFNIEGKPFKSSAESVESLEMKVFPTLSNCMAEYTFTFFPKKRLEVHDWMSLRFSAGTWLEPPLPEEKDEKQKRLKRIIESIIVQPLYGDDYCFTSFCAGLPMVIFHDNDTMEIIFNLKAPINPAEEKWKKAKVIVSPEAGVMTPSEPGPYLYGLRTKTEPKLRESLPVVLEELKLSPARVNLHDSRINQTTGLSLEFDLTPPATMHFQNGFFRIDFPIGTRIQTSKEEYQPGWIKLNEYPLPYIKEMGDNYMVLPIPTCYHEIIQNILYIDPRMGIVNPLKPGEYQLQLSTQHHMQAIPSEIYQITAPKNQGILCVKPSATDSIAEYTISFFPQQEILRGDKISIQFPDSVWVPSSLSWEQVLVNGHHPHKAEVNLDLIEQTVDIVLEHNIAGMSGIEIYFSKEANIRNPMEEEQLILSLNWKGSLQKMTTVEIPIKAQKLEVKSFYIEAPYAEAKSSWRIHLIFGKNRAPSVGESVILKFPFEKDWRSIPIVKQATEMEIVLEDVIVPDPGSYRFRVETHQECLELVFSAEFFILPALPVTVVHIQGGLEGNNGWYLEPPVLRFDKQDPNHILMRNGRQLLNIPEEIFCQETQQIRIITWQSIAPWGTEELQSMEIKIDPVAPSFEVFDLDKEPMITDQAHFTFRGKLQLESLFLYDKWEKGYFFSLTLNGEEIISYGGRFRIARFLNEGENRFHFLAEDEAGNKSEKTYTIIRKT